MQKIIITLIVLSICAGCAHRRTSSVQTVALSPRLAQVKMVPDPSPTSASLAAALPQFSRGAPPIFLKSKLPAFSLRQTLPDVQNISDRPLLAMTEYNGWFWYATDVAPSPDPQAIGAFVSGYAVQKGGHLAWKW